MSNLWIATVCSHTDLRFSSDVVSHLFGGARSPRTGVEDVTVNLLIVSFHCSLLRFQFRNTCFPPAFLLKLIYTHYNLINLRDICWLGFVIWHQTLLSKNTKHLMVQLSRENLLLYGSYTELN